MKLAKKKPVKKSNKSKSRTTTPPKNKATSKKSTVQGASKPGVAKEKLSESSAFKKIKTENLRLAGQLEQKERELVIEAALEKVRAHTMAMQKSEELPEAANTLFQQVQSLGMPAWSAGYCIWSDDQKSVTLWMSSEGVLQPPFLAPTTEDELFIEMRKGSEQGKILHVVEMGGSKLAKHYQYMRTLPVVGKILDSIIEAGHPLPNFQIMHQAYFSKGFLLFITYEPVPEAHNIFIRFAHVFEQTYTRFLDLKKAEAQTREAQIEVALERVRAASMAMHDSKELVKVATILYQQLISLGFDSVVSGGFNFPDEVNNIQKCWLAETESGIMNDFAIKLSGDTVLDERIEFRKKNIPFLEQVLNGGEVRKHLDFLFPPDQDTPEIKASKDAMPVPTVFSIRYLKEGYMILISTAVLSEEQKLIMERFSGVFNLAYTRFLDLQKAEAQAREAKIEAALEKVRSRSLAMHKSDELHEIVKVVFEKLNDLEIGLGGKITIALTIFNESKKELNFWAASEDFSNTISLLVPYHDDPIINHLWNAKESSEGYYAKVFNFEEKNKYWKWALENTNNKFLPDDRKKLLLESESYVQAIALAKQSGIYVHSHSGNLPTEKEIETLSRFANVFDQSYTRFLDLQKAEAQAREAQIEAALERVRSRTMAMQKSEELLEIANTVYLQLKGLQIASTNGIFGFGIIDAHAETMTLWETTFGGNVLTESMTFPLNSGSGSTEMFQKWRALPPTQRHAHHFVIKLDHEQMKQYMAAVALTESRNNSPVNRFIELLTSGEFEKKYSGWVYNNAFFSNGILYYQDAQPVTDEELEILKRFARVFEQTYTRFLDLKKAETQARESQIEAAMEKVRSRSLAMQKPEELTKVAELLRREMGQLGVEELEASTIFIVNKEKKQAECWYAIKDIRKENKQLISDEMTFTFADTWVGNEMGKFYRAKKEHTSIVMKGDNRKEWINYCAGKSNILQGYYGDEIPDRTYHLVKFNGGYMGATSPGDISAESWDLLQRAASVFSLAYTRFNDLQIAEAHALQAEQDLLAIKEAKQKAEEALIELQGTQKQLIQAEKMASLGELTAGIAHEIQNPLNFVNNFSEVNKELLTEMQEEIGKGNFDEVTAIVRDVIANEEKINHHGKRADGIVKGMLQHSRSSSGAKEATDINALCDEYLRLSYHGLRAKDISFNAILNTDYDAAVGKIDLIPQDIGRVILNLVNNAFYAVSEQKKQREGTYQPTVTVHTRKVNDCVLISVKDNGNGIPQKILDKIFQPFFTTKPTGQGTGLGLSLSYDIVKAHGGEIAVETREGEGSAFMVLLPISE